MQFNNSCILQLFGCPSTWSASARAFYGLKLSLLLAGRCVLGGGQSGAQGPVMCGAGLRVRRLLLVHRVGVCGGAVDDGAGRVGCLSRAHRALRLPALG